MISTITIPFQKELFALLESEQKTFKHKRASYNLEKTSERSFSPFMLKMQQHYVHVLPQSVERLFFLKKQ